jgi:hypothetical protein
MLQHRYAPEAGYFSDGDPAADVFGMLTTASHSCGLRIKLAFLN